MRIFEILLNDKKKVYKFEVNKNELKHHPVPPRHQPMNTVPQLRQNLALAHQIQGLIEEGKAEGLKQIAGWLNISHVRICQIIGMLFLSPEIQGEILLSTDKKIFEIPEYKVNEIAKELIWVKQKENWGRLTG